MKHILFTIDGKPKPQKRYGTNRGRTYDPSAQDKREFNLQSRRYAPKEPITGAVLLYVVFYMPVPKGAAKRIKKAAETFAIARRTPLEVTAHVALAAGGIQSIKVGFGFHTKRPDVYNLLKMLKDALTGLMWVDDSQVQIGGCFKIYSHNPRTVIEIYWG